MQAGFLPLFAAVIAVGIGALGQATKDFRLVTSEQARRLAVAEAPRPVPDITLVDQNGTPFALADYRGTPVLVDFIYTSCPSLCTVLGDDFRRIAESIRISPNADRLSLLSISFDVERDGLPELKLYGERYGAEAPAWRIAVPSRTEIAPLLQAFGVVVIRDGYGGFIHNDALYLIDRAGRLVRIMDPDASPQRIEQALKAVS
ncbi:MAG TPA: SCO family protein [Stellaceae bacterium]|nr:SCO family protein [Stellaceae bacterium]